MIFKFSTLEICFGAKFEYENILSCCFNYDLPRRTSEQRGAGSRRVNSIKSLLLNFAARQNVNPFACLFTENSSDFLLGGKSSEPLSLSVFHYCFTNTQKKLSIFHALLGGRWTWSLLNYIFLLLFSFSFFLLLLGANYFKYLYSISFLSLFCFFHIPQHTLTMTPTSSGDLL